MQARFLNKIAPASQQVMFVVIFLGKTIGSFQNHFITYFYFYHRPGYFARDHLVFQYTIDGAHESIFMNWNLRV